MQTKSINSSGVYRVGNITESMDMNKGLESVLTLTVPMDEKTKDSRGMEDMEHDSEEVKTYTLIDLKNLQSKLMLIAGKTAKLQNKDYIESTEEINRFVEVCTIEASWFNLNLTLANAKHFISRYLKVP